MNADIMSPQDTRAHLGAGNFLEYTTPGGTKLRAGRVPWFAEGYVIAYDGQVAGAYGYTSLMHGLVEYAPLDRWQAVKAQP